MQTISGYRLVSIGYVAQNKPRTTNDVEVYLSEKNPMLNGELKDQVIDDTCEGVDYKGKPITAAVKLGNTVTAQWKGGVGNRLTSPDVRRGERVQIFQYGNNDQYYWDILEVPGQSVRKRETITEVFNNSTNENDNIPSEKNSWVREVSTHDKVVTFIKTNRSDGERVAYTFQMDVKNGVWVIADDLGNYIQLDSFESRIELVNSSGSMIDINKDTISIKTKHVKIDASDMIVNVPQTTWKGNTNQTGNINQTGNHATSGTSLIGKSLTVKGGADVTGGMSSGGNIRGTTLNIASSASVGGRLSAGSISKGGGGGGGSGGGGSGGGSGPMTFEGDIQISGNLNVTGITTTETLSAEKITTKALTVAGNASFTGGNYTFNGDITTVGKIMNNEKDIGDTHKHKLDTSLDTISGVL